MQGLEDIITGDVYEGVKIDDKIVRNGNQEFLEYFSMHLGEKKTLKSRTGYYNLDLF